ncbi:MAG: PIN domain-containing protein [Timaviella obliquedivisa GSE-PSE-MK23-08B]|nr:PIN domain-containing protein [Timaviella obliquedivisa GSE-PSE-MK23-08B]
MNALFADTGYFIALLNPGDQLHSQAIRLTQTLTRQTILTSELILIELLNDFSDRGAFFRHTAGQFVNQLQTSRSTQVIHVDSHLFENALTLYNQRSDKAWSLTDCSSFLIMSHYGITDAIAHDKHFIQAGFRALLKIEK